MRYAKIDFRLGYLFQGFLPVRILYKNPFSSSFTLENISADVFIFDGNDYNIKLGSLVPTEPLHIAGRGRKYTPDLAVRVQLKHCLAPVTNFKNCWNSLGAIVGDILIRVDAQASVNFGNGFAVRLNYTEVGLPASFQPQVNMTGQSSSSAFPSPGNLRPFHPASKGHVEI
eukprot:gnl/MRDRNA2_/MRDRNA2_241143_c0_seq1.p1 gnl/MRDRNA2_/MRDRNA2_241143_c0~~gnl/MRDRNA2_/MRDRNA2_241143_c0_seq1.p1  ORF type:complete len:171 (+),score=23.06 gnl/MRDRNA2_/MRDRNA2_241143_c0_seq1:9-521(+)